MDATLLNINTVIWEHFFLIVLGILIPLKLTFDIQYIYGGIKMYQ